VPQVRPHRCDQRVEPVVATDLGHPLEDHAAAEALAAVLRGDQDLQRTEDGRPRRSLGEARFYNGVDALVGEARDVSVPRAGMALPAPTTSSRSSSYCFDADDPDDYVLVEACADGASPPPPDPRIAPGKNRTCARGLGNAMPCA
jgi:hypothetical protein